MAEADPTSHPVSPVSTPDSHAAGTARDLKASKDRTCPFCGQAFTSSSLGRHLDLYIKPKNPKPPDGVHDVDEIRKIRGGITRRQPRTSLRTDTGEGEEGGHRREESSSWRQDESDTGKGSQREKVSDRSFVNSPVEGGKEGGVSTYFNAPIWQATGVINDLPARAPSRSHNATPQKGSGSGSTGGQAQRVHEMRRDNAGNRIERPEYVPEDIWRLQESAEIGKAAEMALREVLGSLEAAKKKAEPRQLYEDFDFLSLSFPAMCLAILPPPPTLFSATPFAAAHTWALTPPGERQWEALNRMLNERFAWIRNGKPSNMPDSQVFKNHVHLENSYEQWKLLSETDRTSAWNIEISRAFVNERSKKQDLKRDLENAQQRVRHLEAEYDRLSRCQLPREYLLHPPNTIPVSSPVMREMRSTDSKSAAAEVNYDAETLLDKWKAVVKSTARPARAPPTHGSVVSGANGQQVQYVETTRNQMKGDMVLSGAVLNVGGPMPRNADLTGSLGVSYETPRVPGTVFSADDEGEGEAEGKGDGEVDADGDEDGDAGQGALMRIRGHGAHGGGGGGGFENGDVVTGAINRNGKRALEGDGGWKHGVTRFYKEPRRA